MKVKMNKWWKYKGGEIESWSILDSAGCYRIKNKVYYTGIRGSQILVGSVI